MILLLPISLMEWLFNLNITPYFDYYFDKIFLSGSTAFSYLKAVDPLKKILSK